MCLSKNCFPPKSTEKTKNIFLAKKSFFFRFKITCTCCYFPSRFPTVIINSFENVYAVFKTSTWCCCTMAGVFLIISVKMKCEHTEPRRRRKIYTIQMRANRHRVWGRKKKYERGLNKVFFSFWGDRKCIRLGRVIFVLNGI